MKTGNLIQKKRVLMVRIMLICMMCIAGFASITSLAFANTLSPAPSQSTQNATKAFGLQKAQNALVATKTLTAQNALVSIAQDDLALQNDFAPQNTLEAQNVTSANTEVYAQKIYRLYNETTSEHLFTYDKSEYDSLPQHGWTQEKYAWDSASSGGTGVYRLYNEGLGAMGKMSHLYTTSVAEANDLVANWGWKYDNNGNAMFYSTVDASGNKLTGSTSVYRLYNDGLSAHHYTLDASENTNLINNQGWSGENVGFYAYTNTDSGITDSNGVAVVADKSQNNRLTEVTVYTTNSTSSTKNISNVPLYIDLKGNVNITFSKDLVSKNNIDINNLVIKVKTLNSNVSDNTVIKNRDVILKYPGYDNGITLITNDNGEAKYESPDPDPDPEPDPDPDPDPDPEPQPVTYTVTFDTDGGEPAPDAQTVESGKKAERPATDPAKAGYTFKGWTLNGADYDFDAAITGNITLKAKWTENPNNVEIKTTGTGSATMSIAGVTYDEEGSANIGDTITITPAPDDDNYVAQVRYGTRAVGTTADPESFTAIKDNGGTYTITKTDDDMQIYVDFVSKVWDGTMDVSWYDPATTEYHIQYPAQFEGLAAIINGIFTTYPQKTIAATDKVVEHKVPDYEAYLTTMGAKYDKKTETITDPQTKEETTKDTYTVKSSNLYGEFTSSYNLVDMQIGTSSKVSGIEKTARVIGDASYIVCNSSIGTHGANNLVTTSTYYYGDDDMDGKSIYIDSDLDFGGTKTGDLWNTSSPLFMSLGGQYALIPQNGYSVIGSSFNGKLDGLGHKFKNVYGEHYCAGGNFGDSQSLGIVGRLGNHDGDPDDKAAVNPTVRQIVFESGWMSARRTSGCIVGKIGQTTATRPSGAGDGSTGGIIEYCINKADIIGTDKKGIAGICGAGWNKGVIRYCANFGSVKCAVENAPASGFLAGGIVGSCEVPVIGCYNAGDVITGNTGTSRYSEAIGSNNGSCSWTNCFYLYGSDHNIDSPGVYKGTSTNVKSFGAGGDYEKLEAWMPNGAESATSGTSSDGANIWFDDTSGINAKDGVNYPVLFYQADDTYSDKEFTITVKDSAEGTVVPSAVKAKYGDTITLTSNVTNQLYKFKNYIVNGVATTNASITVTEDVTISAEFEQLGTAIFQLEDTTGKDWIITAKKTGIINDNGVAKQAENVDLKSGDALYEGDVITLYPVLNSGAKPEDVNKEYTGGFNCQFFGDKEHASLLVGSRQYTVTATDTYVEGSVKSAITQDKTWLSLADTSWYDNNKSASTYTISTAAQLAGVAKLLNDYADDQTAGTNFSGKTIQLGSDVSLANTDGTTGTRYWCNIACNGSVSSGTAFAGTLDGQNHKITNMNSAYDGYSISGAISSRNRGFISCASGAAFKNLTIEGTVYGYSESIGGIVGMAQNTSFENCTSNVTIASAPDASSVNAVTNCGGIAGAGEACTFTNCTNAGSINVNAGTSSVDSAVGRVGGIVGYAKGNSETATVTFIIGCKNTASVSTDSAKSNNAYMGGIAGYMDDARAIKSANTGNITCASSSDNTMEAGGITGYMKNVSTITECANRGNVSNAYHHAAGICAHAYGENVISDSYNQGNVTSNGTQSYNAYAAGLVAEVYGTLVLGNCYTSGAVTSGVAGANAAICAVTNKTPMASNVFYLDTTAGTPDTTIAYSAGTVSAKTATDMQSSAFAASLGSSFVAKADAYPALAWE